METEILKQIVKEAVSESTLTNGLIIAIVPVITTIIVNTIYDIFRRKSESKKKYSMEQLKELYLPLYAIISQSEYFRYFYEVRNNFEEVPFLEVNKNKDKKMIDLTTGITTQQVVKVVDSITKFSKAEMDKLILEKCQYSSINLIKLAVAHRYLEDNYLTVDNQKIAEKFADEEVKILGQLVKLVIKETNEKLKYCSMNYDISEIENKIMNVKIFK